MDAVSTTNLESIACCLTSLWRRGALNFSSMSANEVELATRYACRELNGFPEWFPQLLAQREDDVSKTLMLAISGEWDYPSDQQHVYGILYKLVWQIFDTKVILRGAIELLKAGDPKNNQILSNALDLLMKYDLGRTFISSSALSRELGIVPGSAPWLMWVAAWLKVDDLAAIHSIEQRIAEMALPDADVLVISLSSQLLDQRGNPTSDVAHALSYQEPACLRRFIPLVIKHVRSNEDRVHTSGEAYSPTARDNAERFRYLLWEVLRDSESPDTDNVLRDLLIDPVIAANCDRIRHMLDSRRSLRADDVPWNSADVRSFAEKHLIAPRSDYTFFRLICRHIEDIKATFERSETPGARKRLRDEDLEDSLRNLLHEELKKRAGDWYTVTAESEVDLEQRPDLTISRPQLNSLPIEVKLANLKHWQLHKLLERLENQLVGQYLRAESIRYGIYILGNTNPKRRWSDVTSSTKIDFQTVVVRISERAKSLVNENRPGVDGIAVIGIDFSDPRKRIDTV